MLYLTLFTAELVALFFLSRRVQKNLGIALYRFTRNRKFSIYLMALLFFPGTFVHEMSHFLAALFLLVPVGNMELLPKLEDDSVKLGSVEIGKTDPIRRFLIGTAPFFVGTLLILSVIYYADIFYFKSGGVINLSDILVIIGAMYIVFTVTNTMFSSKKDMEGMWGFIAVVILTISALWIFDINIDLAFLYSSTFTSFFGTACLFLIAPLILDIIALVLLSRK